MYLGDILHGEWNAATIHFRLTAKPVQFGTTLRADCPRSLNDQFFPFTFPILPSHIQDIERSRIRRMVSCIKSPRLSSVLIYIR